MAIQRLRVEWSGTGVEGPGLSTFYAEADGTVAISVAAAALFAEVESWIPTGTTIRVPNGGDVIDETTGSLTGTWGTSTSTTINCSGAGGFPGGVGARVVWETDVVLAGRRVRGSTFLAPFITSAFATDGTLGPTTITDVESGIANFLVQAPTQARVWSRPRPGVPGSASAIARGRVPDTVSWLRSRRT